VTYETARWRQRLHTVIFEADTRAGRAFDVALIACILASIGLVVLESVAAINARWHRELFAAELVFTVLFTVRIFRILKLSEYLVEAAVITAALRASRRKIAVFLYAVMTLVVLIGALMYMVEGPAHGFTDIPVSMYWAIVTLTTVGYGDLSPQTGLGKLLASVVMVLARRARASGEAHSTHRDRRKWAAILGRRSRVNTPFRFRPPIRMMPWPVLKSAKFQTCTPATNGRLAAASRYRLSSST
jgi:voltage-gated potassium channel Kch